MINDNLISNEFNQLNYDEVSISQLIEYSNKLGISSDGSKKDLYNRINLLLDTKSIIKKEQNRNINPFNQDLPELRIKDISNGEKLFWSIFRNKWLFKKIFSNFEFSGSYSYDQLIYVPSLFIYYKDAVEILKDKVKSSSHLVFQTICSHGLLEICKYIHKDTKENRELIQALFDKYPSVSTNYSNSILFAVTNSNKFMLEFIIKHYHLTSLQVKETIALAKGYFFELDKNPLDYKAFKFLDYLIEKDYFPDIKVDVRYFDIFEKKYPLKFITKSVQLLTKLKGTAKDISEFKRIELLYQFSKQELDTSIRKLVKSNITAPNPIAIQTLKGYADLFYKSYFNDKEIPPEYYLFFDYDQNTVLNLFIKRNLNIYHYHTLFKYTLKNDIAAIKKFIDFSSNSEVRADLFYTGVLTYDNFELVQFLHSLSSFGLTIVGVFPMIYYITSSLKSKAILDLYHSKFPNFIIHKDLSRHWSYFKDLEILELVEDQMIRLGRKFLVDDFTNQDALTLKDSKQLEILIRALNKPSVYQVSSTLNFGSYSPFILQYISQNKLETVIEFFKTFKFKEISLSLIYSNYNQRKLKYLSRWIFNQIARGDGQEKQQPWFTIIENNQVKVLTLFENGTKSITFIFTLSQLLLSLCCTGQFNLLFQLIESNTSNLLTLINDIKPSQIDATFEISFVPTTALIECFKYSIEKLKTDTNIRDFVFKLICIAARESHYPFFTLLISNYSFLLIKNSDSNNGWFTTEKLNEILEVASKSNDQSIYNLLKNFIN